MVFCEDINFTILEFLVEPRDGTATLGLVSKQWYGMVKYILSKITKISIDQKDYRQIENYILYRHENIVSSINCQPLKWNYFYLNHLYNVTQLKLVEVYEDLIRHFVAYFQEVKLIILVDCIVYDKSLFYNYKHKPQILSIDRRNQVLLKKFVEEQVFDIRLYRNDTSWQNHNPSYTKTMNCFLPIDYEPERKKVFKSLIQEQKQAEREFRLCRISKRTK